MIDRDDDAAEDNANANDGLGAGEKDGAWQPYTLKTMFMVDLLDRLPRLCLSDDHLKLILWVMKNCGTPGVLSLKIGRAHV